MHWLTKQLTTSQVYSDTIELYVTKQCKAGHYLAQGLDAIELNFLLQEKDSLAKILAELFSSGQLSFAMLQRKVIDKNNKRRIVYTSETLENPEFKCETH